MDSQRYACPVEVTLDIIGGRWKGVILHHLLENEVLRFGELRRRVPSCTQQMLTNALRELESEGVIERQVYAQVPPKVEYRISEFGRGLAPIVKLMCLWGKEHQARIEAGKEERRAVS